MPCSPPGSSVHGDSPAKNTEVGCLPSWDLFPYGIVITYIAVSQHVGNWETLLQSWGFPTHLPTFSSYYQGTECHKCQHIWFSRQIFWSPWWSVIQDFFEHRIILAGACTVWQAGPPLDNPQNLGTCKLFRGGGRGFPQVLRIWQTNPSQYT